MQQSVSGERVLVRVLRPVSNPLQYICWEHYETVYGDENRTKFDALNIGGDEILELRYANDTTLLSSTASGLEEMILSVQSHSEVQNLYLNVNKTKIMNKDKTKTKITINGKELENVNTFE